MKTTNPHTTPTPDTGIVAMPPIPYQKGDKINTETWRSCEVGSGYEPDGERIAGVVKEAAVVRAYGCSSRWQRVTVTPIAEDRGTTAPDCPDCGHAATLTPDGGQWECVNCDVLLGSAA